MRHGLKLLAEIDGDADDGVVFDRIRSLLFLAPDDQIDLITPVWPPHYPGSATTDDGTETATLQALLPGRAICSRDDTTCRPVASTYANNREKPQ